MRAILLQHPHATVQFQDPAPPPASVPAPQQADFRLSFVETPEDGRRPDPVQKRLDMEHVAMLCDLCGAEALVTVLELSERYGLATLLIWTRNIAALQGSR